MHIFTELFSELWNVWVEMISLVWSFIPKLFMICLWGLSAAIIFPCVFIASHLYPLWVEWGEDL